MGFSREKLLNWPFADVLQAYTQRDSILYALSLGFGSEPTNPQHLRFVYERGLESFPTMAVVLGHPGAWMADPETCIDLLRVLHGEQHLRLHRPLPPSGELRAVNRVTEVLDKGAGKGALITIERQLFDAAGGGDPYSTQQAVIFARGNGGFGGPTGPSRPPHPLPQREPDATVDIATLPQSALLYRLNGDYNPLHADPEVAARAGFPAPILHGLASFGIAARAVSKPPGSHRPAVLGPGISRRKHSHRALGGAAGLQLSSERPRTRHSGTEQWLCAIADQLTAYQSPGSSTSIRPSTSRNG